MVDGANGKPSEAMRYGEKGIKETSETKRIATNES